MFLDEQHQIMCFLRIRSACKHTECKPQWAEDKAFAPRAGLRVTDVAGVDYQWEVACSLHSGRILLIFLFFIFFQHRSGFLWPAYDKQRNETVGEKALAFYTGHVVPPHLTWQPSRKRKRGESQLLSHPPPPSLVELLRWGEAVLVIMFNLFSAQPLVFTVELSKTFAAILNSPQYRCIVH